MFSRPVFTGIFAFILSISLVCGEISAKCLGGRPAGPREDAGIGIDPARKGPKAGGNDASGNHFYNLQQIYALIDSHQNWWYFNRNAFLFPKDMILINDKGEETPVLNLGSKYLPNSKEGSKPKAKKKKPQQVLNEILDLLNLSIYRGDFDSIVRRMSVSVLKTYQDEELNLLLTFLTKNDKQKYAPYRRAAASAFGDIGYTQAIPYLRECVTNRKIHKQDQTLRAFAALSLGKLQDADSKSMLLNIISHKQETHLQKSYAIMGLAYLMDENLAKALMPVLEDRNASNTLKRVTMIALARNGYGKDKVLDLLENSPKDMIRGQAALLLWFYAKDTPEEAFSLVQKLDTCIKKEKNAMARSRMVKALGQFNRSESRTILRRLFNEEKEDLVLSAAAMSLGFIGEPQDLALLETLMANKKYSTARTYAAMGMGLLKNPKALGPLKETLTTSKEENLLCSSVLAVTLLNHEESIPTLMEVFAPKKKKHHHHKKHGHHSHEVQEYASLCLGALNASESKELLTNALSDHDADVRHAAAVGIGLFRDPALLPKLETTLKKDRDYFVRFSAAFGIDLTRPLTDAPLAMGTFLAKEKRVTMNQRRADGEEIHREINHFFPRLHKTTLYWEIF